MKKKIIIPIILVCVFIFLVVHNNQVESLSCNTTTKIIEVVECCSLDVAVCWTEGTEISIGNETDKHRLTNYECHSKNQTWISMCFTYDETTTHINFIGIEDLITIPGYNDTL